MAKRAKKRVFHYPTGIRRPKMHSYHRKNVKQITKKKRVAQAIRNKFSGGKYNKYNAHKIHINGHDFDSKIEYSYYKYLKFNHINFKVHPRCTTIDHFSYKFHGKKHSIYKRSYTPDFVIYDSSFKHIKYAVDIKGGKASPYSKLRMALYTLRYHIPVMIVKRRKKHFIYKENH